MKWEKSSEALKKRFIEITSQLPNTDQKKMFGYPCVFYKGNLFSGLHQQNWIIRLSEEERKEIEQLGGKPFEPMPGRVMKEYRTLPEKVLEEDNKLIWWIEKSFTYAKTLKPKAPKAKKK